MGIHHIGLLAPHVLEQVMALAQQLAPLAMEWERLQQPQQQIAQIQVA